MLTFDQNIEDRYNRKQIWIITQNKENSKFIKCIPSFFMCLYFILTQEEYYFFIEYTIRDSELYYCLKDTILESKGHLFYDLYCSYSRYLKYSYLFINKKSVLLNDFNLIPKFNIYD